MKKIRLKRKKDCVTISRRLRQDEQLNVVELDIMSKGEVPAFYPPQVLRSVLGIDLQFCLPPFPSLEEILSQGIDFGRFCAFILELVRTIQSCEAHGIRVGNLELRAEYIFCEEERLRLLYWPVISPMGQTADIPQIFKTFGERCRCPEADQGYMDAYLAFFRSRTKFDVLSFEKVLQKLSEDWRDGRSGDIPAPAAGTVFLKRSGGGVIRVDKFPFTFGRDPESCDYLFSDDRMISRVHMSLRERGGSVYVYDAGSLNGTSVNGAPVGARRETEVLPGDAIQLGSQELVYVFEEEIERAGTDI